MKLRRLLLLVLAVVFTFSAATDAVGCIGCVYSPHDWGFCRAGESWGGTTCITKVVDDFSGRTDCDSPYDCRQGGTRIVDGIGDGGGGGSACWWTDLYGNCII